MSFIPLQVFNASKSSGSAPTNGITMDKPVIPTSKNIIEVRVAEASVPILRIVFIVRKATLVEAYSTVDKTDNAVVRDTVILLW